MACGSAALWIGLCCLLVRDQFQGDDLPQLLSVGFATDPERPHLGYGLGVSIGESEHGLVYGHSGFFPGYNSKVAYYPDHEVAVAIQINSDESQIGGHTTTLANLVLETLSAGGSKAAGPAPR